MPRRREVPKREILPDPKFGSQDVSKVHERDHAQRQEVGRRAHHLWCVRADRSQKSGKDPLEVFRIALNNVKPMVEVKSRRVGGANYQVPVEVRPSSSHGAGDALAEGCGAQAWREVHGCRVWRVSCWRPRRPWRRGEEA